MRYMGIDLGDKRTGIALSDGLGKLASPFCVLHETSEKKLSKEIRRIASEQEIGAMVLGCPVNMDGSKGERAQKSEDFCTRLKEKTDIPVILWDERLSTVEAHRKLASSGMDNRERKDIVDAAAAAIILQSYLDGI